MGRGDYITEVKDLSFCFEDLVNLDLRSIQRIIAQVGNEVLTRSLYGASAEIREKFFSAMSSGASTMIKEDLEVLGELPLAEVETARNETLRSPGNWRARG